MVHFFGHTFNTKYLYSFLTVLLVSISLLTGCSKKDDNSTNPGTNPGGTNNAGNSVTINGEGYSNQKFDIASAATLAHYEVTQDATVCTFVSTGTATTIQVICYFHGKQLKTYQWDNASDDYQSANAGMMVIINNGSETKYYNSLLNSGSTVVTAYGNVGQTISGTFSGTVTNIADPQKSMTVNGSFNTTRLPDN